MSTETVSDEGRRHWMRFIDERQCPLVLIASGETLREVRFGADCIPDGVESAEPVLVETTRQLRLYFAGKLERFELPLAPTGTAFQQRVWQALLSVPYGETRSYSEIARAIGSEKAVRAVGAANGRNPIPVIIPCHRIIGATGKLTGFGGGLPLKRFLLQHEQITMGRQVSFAWNQQLARD